MAEIAGLTGKRAVAVDVLSPLLLADRDDGAVPALLAGEVLGDFGGFLSRDLRSSDFALGYASTRRWLDDGLPWSARARVARLALRVATVLAGSATGIELSGVLRRRRPAATGTRRDPG